MRRRTPVSAYGRWKAAGAFSFNAVMLALAAVNVFPLIFMIYSSLKTKQEYLRNVFSLPSVPMFSNYADAVRVGKLQSGVLNSAIISALSVSVIITMAFVIGYCLARYKFKGRNFLYIFFISGMMVPIHALMVPLFVEFKYLSLLNSRAALVISYVAFGLPLAVFLIEGFVRMMPYEVEEAALIDGSSFANTLLRVVAPMCLPVLSTAVIMAFLDTWNEFSFALILISSENLKTLPLRLTGFAGQYTTDHTKLLAALVIATLPVLLIYLILNKKVIEGMVAGAVKG